MNMGAEPGRQASSPSHIFDIVAISWRADRPLNGTFALKLSRVILPAAARILILMASRSVRRGKSHDTRSRGPIGLRLTI